MNTNLISNLIAIPSFVDEKRGVDESRLADFIYNFLAKRAPWLRLQKQYIGKRRYNIIVTSQENLKILFFCHMDTVLPTQGHISYSPRIVNKKIYGLGAVDMKAGVAAVLSAVVEVGPQTSVGLIFDCDEEYHFSGIKAVCRRYSFSPRMAVFPEPTDEKAIYGCRGLVQIQFNCIGKTAHAADPAKGINAIEGAVRLCQELQNQLGRSKDSVLGTTSVNLASLTGGRRYKADIVEQANAVPDIARVTLDIRPTRTKTNAKEILRLLDIIASKQELSVINQKIILDYAPFVSQTQSLRDFEIAIEKTGARTRYSKNIGKAGFFEAAFIANQWSCPCVVYGPGPAYTAHTKEECIDIESLERVTKVFGELLRM